jgi:hypothetical protein
MFLAIGEDVVYNRLLSVKRTLIDIAPTIAEHISISAVYSKGSSFADLLSQQISYTYCNAEEFDGYNFITWGIDSDVLLMGCTVKRANVKNGEFKIISSYEYDKNLKNESICKNNSSYTFIDNSVNYGVNYWYKVIAVDYNDVQFESEPVFATPSGNDISKFENFILEQNYPNPFNPITIINYQLPMTNDVELSIYNLLGQKVATLVNEQQQAGYHQVEWDASRFSSGVYHYSIQAGEFQDVKKMILIK